MALLSLACIALYGVVAVGWRGWLHTRRTGRNPFRGGAGIGGAAAVWGLAAALVAGPVTDLTHMVPRLIHGWGFALAGLLLAAAGLGLVCWAQLAMGDAWRIGVDPNERTQLATAGPFQAVRNPIYSGMVGFAVGMVLLVPNVVSVLGLAALTAALDLHVRKVEEPYLESTFGSDFLIYGRRVGRFVPGLGKLAADGAGHRPPVAA